MVHRMFTSVTRLPDWYYIIYTTGGIKCQSAHSSEFIFKKLKSHKNLIKMPKDKVLTLYQKAKICEMSLTPGFIEEKCEKEFGIQRSC